MNAISLRKNKLYCVGYTKCPCKGYRSTTHLINKIGDEKCKGKYASDKCTGPDVGGLATGPLTDDSLCSWTPVPVSTLNNARVLNMLVIIVG